MPEENKEQHEKEYAALLAIFSRFVDSIGSEQDSDEVLYELMALRADFAIGYALRGFSVTLDEALELIRKKDGLTDEENARRNVIVAAMDNIIDFAVAEEFQMVDELPPIDENEDDIDEETMAELMAIFAKYNQRYALVENGDIEYSMIIAAGLVAMSESTTLMYMTMGDERVRPWHLQYEGFTAPKHSFPAWLIPPIEHGCRCYLVEDTSSILGSVKAQTVPQMPEWFNPTFKESVALGGRIFSDEHPYFEIPEEFVTKLSSIAKRIKDKYFNA